MGDLTRASFRFLIGPNASFYAWLLRRGIRLSSDTLAFVYTFPPLWVMSGLSPARVCPCWAHNATQQGCWGRFCALGAGISSEIPLSLSRYKLSVEKEKLSVYHIQKRFITKRHFRFGQNEYHLILRCEGVAPMVCRRRWGSIDHSDKVDRYASEDSCTRHEPHAPTGL